MKLVIITTHLEHAHTTYWRRVRASQWLELAERIKVQQLCFDAQCTHMH